MFHPVSRLPDSRRPAWSSCRPMTLREPPLPRPLLPSRMRPRPREAKQNQEQRDSAAWTGRIRCSRRGGAVAEALADRRRGRRHPVRHRRGDLAGPVPARLPDRLYFVAGTQPWLPGFADGATSFRRRVGLGDPPRTGSRQQVSSADVRVVSADSVRAATPVRVDDRPVADSAEWLVLAHVGLDRLDCPLDPLLRDLGMARLHADKPWRSTGPSFGCGFLAALSGTKRSRTGAVFLDGIFRGRGLGDVARSPMGLDDLWAHLHRWAGLVGAGV